MTPEIVRAWFPCRDIARDAGIALTNGVGTCPACGTKSLLIHAARNLWSCATCRTTGDAIDLHASITRTDRQTALAVLAAAIPEPPHAV